MIALKELTKGLGPQLTQRLTAANIAVDTAHAEVIRLGKLREKRLAAQPLQAVGAGDDPAAVAKDSALASAVDTLVTAIDRELTAAQAAERQAKKAYSELAENIRIKSELVFDINGKITTLTTKRDGLLVELSR